MQTFMGTIGVMMLIVSLWTLVQMVKNDDPELDDIFDED
jgi:hypothetical protein